LESHDYESVAGAEGTGKPYRGDISAIDAQQPFRAARLTPKPLMQGPQTAIVVGKSGEEIWTDEYGRVKCQFPWDRYGKSDENSSCWIRVSQSWAGKKWGAMNIPRIGQEVIVDFLEGDPDQPIITGRVYNGINMPPYALPDKATMSTLKSNSSKGGDGFNEIRLEDKKDEEQLFIHAQRNEDIRVKKDAMEWIGEERHLIVKKKQFEQVEGEKHQIIKSGDGGAGHHNAKVDGTVSLKVVGDQKEDIGGDQHLKIGSRQNIKTGGTVSLNVGQDLQQKVAAKCAVDAGQEIHLKAGMKVIIEAGMQLTIKAGASFIDIGPAGITISGTPMVKIVGGPMVMINSCGGSAGSGSGCSPASPSAPTAPTAPKEAANAESGQVSDTQAQSPAQQQSHSLDSVTVDNSQMDNGDSGAGGGGGSSSSSQQPRQQTEPDRERERAGEGKEDEDQERIRQNRQAESARKASDSGRPFRKP
jgi:type VI secretion system secreted protein VgrG